MTPSVDAALLLDRGSAWTKCNLVARLGQRWRLVAHVSQPTAWDEEGLLAAVASRAEAVADRALRSHVPRILAGAPRIECHTPARPARMALAAVSRDVSGEVARRTAESAGWVVAESVTIDDGRQLADRLAALQSAEVDAWLVVGGFDGASGEQALEMAALVAAARGIGRAPVIWAGSAALTRQVSELFEPGGVTMVDNPRPAPEVDRPVPLRRTLEELMRRTVEPSGPSRLAPIAYARGIAALAASSELSVIGVDLGARYATWVRAARGSIEARVQAEGGVASPALTEGPVPARLARGLPQAVDELAVADVLQNIRARPASVPQTEDDLLIMHAAVRHQLGHLADAASDQDGVDLLLGSGSTLAAAPRPGLAAALLVDGMRPLGVTQLAIEPPGVLGPLGSLPDDEVLDGVRALRDDLLVPLGASVVSRGGRPGQVAMRVELRRGGGRAATASEAAVEVRYGQLLAVPLGHGERVELRVTLERDVTLGEPAGEREIRARVTGGSVGLVLDARDIPLAVPKRLDDRRAVVASWHQALLSEPLPAGARS